jgi:hypothetical protein
MGPKKEKAMRPNPVSEKGINAEPSSKLQGHLDASQKQISTCLVAAELVPPSRNDIRRGCYFVIQRAVWGREGMSALSICILLQWWSIASSRNGDASRPSNRRIAFGETYVLHLATDTIWKTSSPFRIIPVLASGSLPSLSDQ